MDMVIHDAQRIPQEPARRYRWKIAVLALTLCVTGMVGVTWATVPELPPESEPLRHNVQRPQEIPLPSPPGESRGTPPGNTGWEAGGSPAFNLPAVGGTGKSPNASAGTPTAPPTGSAMTRSAGGRPGTDSSGGTTTSGTPAANGAERGSPARYTLNTDRRGEADVPSGDEETAAGKEPPKWSHGTLILLLLISLSLNGYMIWLTLDTRNRYFRLMNEMNGDMAQDEEDRDRRSSRGGANAWQSGLNRVRNISRGAVSKLRHRQGRSGRSHEDEDVDED